MHKCIGLIYYERVDSFQITHAGKMSGTHFFVINGKDDTPQNNVKRAFVERVDAECQAFDIPFFLVAALRPWTDVPFHVHLMTEHPASHVSTFAEAGANLITVHHENGEEAFTAIEQIHRHGLAAGVALQLETPPEAIMPYLDKVQLILLMGTRLGVKGQSLDPNTYTREQTIRQMIHDSGYEGRVKIGVDGGIREQTVPLLRNAGADLVVPGSLVFKSTQLAQTFRWLHALSLPTSSSEDERRFLC